MRQRRNEAMLLMSEMRVASRHRLVISPLAHSSHFVIAPLPHCLIASFLNGLIL